MHSDLIDEDRSVKSLGDHSECVSALFMSHKTPKNHSSQKWNTICVAESVDIA